VWRVVVGKYINPAITATGMRTWLKDAKLNTDKAVIW
jgi:hypothetical protein